MESSPSEDSTEDVGDGDDAVTELHATDEEFQMVGDHRVPSYFLDKMGLRCHSARGPTPQLHQAHVRHPLSYHTPRRRDCSLDAGQFPQ